ncbi:MULTISPECIES: GNAT family N-acetyltransferase [Methylocystis]|uniref:GNAT family N-acetyltransferase n=1 Tax=Methylocystis TaxID=133 RepID=UPI00192321CB|nr:MULTISPECIES: GNAT family N-acyltransferase [Methylocystis]MBL1257319.1 GNAT family N-acetyltransferase [Methylocystis sp. Sn-Cys]
MWTSHADIGRTIAALTNLQPPSPQNKTIVETLGRMGSLEARLARRKGEIRKAQRLRYEVFYKEGGAIPDAKTAFTRRDADKFDKYCDHLIVIDHAWTNKRGKVKPKIVGAYRLLRGDMAQKAGGFYSAGEYDIAPLLARHAGKRILELGRSCVLESHRSKRTIELLWRGLLAYIRAHQIDVMIGCASFPGVSPLAHAQALSYLAHYAGAQGEWRVKAKTDLYVPMAMAPKDSLDAKAAREALSPLIKGYLRLGARFGDGAVVDLKFNTTDVFVVMPVAEIGARYIEYFSGVERRAA